MVIRDEMDGNTTIQYYPPDDEGGDTLISESITLVQPQIEAQVRAELDIGRCENEEPSLLLSLKPNSTDTFPISNSESTNEAKSSSKVLANEEEDDDDDIIFLDEIPNTRPQKLYVLTENSSNNTRRMVMGPGVIVPDGNPGFNLHPLDSAYEVLTLSSFAETETLSLEGSESFNDPIQVEDNGVETIPVQTIFQGKEREEQTSDSEGDLIIDEGVNQEPNEVTSREDDINRNLNYDLVSDKDDRFGQHKEVEMSCEVDIEEPDPIPYPENEEKIDFFCKGLDQDDELLVESKRRPAGMNFMCGLCYDWFETKEQINVHMNDVHLNGTRFHHCKICNGKFLARFLLLRHEKLHEFDPKLPYSCYVSPRGQPIRELVDNHYLYRVRPGRLTKPYLSDLSKKLGRLAAQIYKCIECEATFSTDTEMTEHYEQVHAVKKCLFCPEAYDTFEVLKHHMETVHCYQLPPSHEAVYWKFWAKVAAKAESPDVTEASNLSMFHSYSKPSGTIEADNYYRERDSRFEGLVECDSGRLDEDDIENVLKKEVPLKDVMEEENKEGALRPKRKESFTKGRSGSGHSPISFNLPGSGFKNGPTPENGTMDSTSTSGLSCSICHRVFVHVNDLEEHYRSHKGERPFLCQYCGRGFGNNINRSEHERSHTVTAQDKPYKCQYCDRQFVQRTNFKKHLETHRGSSTFKCSTCAKEFAKESSLSLHQRAHASDRKFKCHLCDSAYNYASLLKRHLRIHSGDRPYECDMCGMLFHELVSLNYHRMKIHTGERPHKCKECDRAFILSSDLKKHMGVHNKLLSVTEEQKECEGPLHAPETGHDDDSIQFECPST